MSKTTPHASMKDVLFFLVHTTRLGLTGNREGLAELAARAAGKLAADYPEEAADLRRLIGEQEAADALLTAGDATAVEDAAERLAISVNRLEQLIGDFTAFVPPLSPALPVSLESLVTGKEPVT